MYLNRFVLDIKPHGIENSFIKGRTLRMIEEFFFHLMPKKVNMNDYGFFTLSIFTEGQGENKISAGGQIIEFNYRKSLLNPVEFANLTTQQQFNWFLDIIENALKEIDSQLEIDMEKFDYAIAGCRANWPIRFEEKLKISKAHSTRKLKIDFVRILEFTGESIHYKLLDKDNNLLEEKPLKNDSSIYDARYDYKSSKWNGNELLVFDRFDKQTLKIDVSNYINK